ncbi:hypothetical protein EJ05DRAFT_55838 [Pseudovirgaria hyperparasitica]|uniref:DNA2/NAM7 helicase-like C-terminal domain-containing protein n=1 Tax=Pseudovirgaria hyperparasitica TaxID=470096 RepID=A0A6A6W3C2_9PEZI|nr:uncharacterized protein EJ05DRAFT_55838 [Pseudovirgaria hyperparasitica]KAF2757103.1 hypothetical protein EJ05DRAFT_55838 [Pseudovirgaria hyperparasitica]
MVGDKHQTGVSTKQTRDNANFAENAAHSMMARLMDCGFAYSQLLTSERSCEAIVKPISKACYGGLMKASGRRDPPKDPNGPCYVALLQHVFNLPSPHNVVFINAATSPATLVSKSLLNTDSLRIELSIAKALLRSTTAGFSTGISAADILHISPYAAHKALASKTFQRLDPRLQATTIVAFDRPGFMKEHSRIIVAPTRTQYGLVVVGNMSHLLRSGAFRGRHSLSVLNYGRKCAGAVVEFDMQQIAGLAEL